MLKLHSDSHRDHGLSVAHLDYLLDTFRQRDGFFIETTLLPGDLPPAQCALYGPAMGDPPIVHEMALPPYTESTNVVMRQRGVRPYLSRVITGARTRPCRYVTLIAGPHDGESCVVYTAFGGPLAPKEPGELAATIAEHVANAWLYTADDNVEFDSDDLLSARDALVKLRKQYEESKKFWAEHALAWAP